jgi:hypothetical protein
MSTQIERFLRYLIYSIVSIFCGTISSLSGDKDLLMYLGKNLFTTLITIFVLYTTLSNLVLTQVFELRKKSNKRLDSIIKSLKRSVIIMFGIIATDFIIFIALDFTFNGSLGDYILVDKCFTLNLQALPNTLTFFSIFYFLYTVYDSSRAFYDLAEFNINNP